MLELLRKRVVAAKVSDHPSAGHFCDRLRSLVGHHWQNRRRHSACHFAPAAHGVCQSAWTLNGLGGPRHNVSKPRRRRAWDVCRCSAFAGNANARHSAFCTGRAGSPQGAETGSQIRAPVCTQAVHQALGQAARSQRGDATNRSGSAHGRGEQTKACGAQCRAGQCGQQTFKTEGFGQAGVWVCGQRFAVFDSQRLQSCNFGRRHVHQHSVAVAARFCCVLRNLMQAHIRPLLSEHYRHWCHSRRLQRGDWVSPLA